MNKQLLNIKNIGIPLIVVGLVILGVIFLLTRNNQTNTDQTPLSYIDTDTSNITLLPVEDLQAAKLADSSVTFNENYFINTVLQGHKISGVVCGQDETNSCIINFITDGTDTYYVSTPFEPISTDGMDRTNDIAKEFQANTGTIFLKYSVLKAYDEAGAPIPSKDVYSQIYGCITDNICVGSGLLNISDSDANKAQVAKFEDFVRSINLQ